MNFKRIIIGAALWLVAIFASYLRIDVTGIWWQNVILWSSLQTIGTAIMVKGGR